MIRIHTISFLALVSDDVVHGRGLGVALTEVLADQTASWVVQFRWYDLSLCPRSPLLGARVLHQRHAGAPSLPISLSVGVQLRLLLLWKSGQIDQSCCCRPH